MAQIEGFATSPIGAVLTDQEIRRLASAHELVHPFEEGSLQGASYDMRMGPQCSAGGRIKTLTENEPDHRLEPGDFILLLSFECLKLPIDIVGRAGLISRWAQKGLVSLFSPQIDPGFEGHIIVPLFNAGNLPVTLMKGEAMFTVEFLRTTGPSSVNWADNHNPLRAIPSRGGMEMARPDVTDLDRRLGELAGKVRELDTSVKSFQAGFGTRQAVSAKRAAWWALPIAVVALGAPWLWKLLGIA